jgi:hypothetical protein
LLLHALPVPLLHPCPISTHLADPEVYKNYFDTNLLYNLVENCMVYLAAACLARNLAASLPDFNTFG